MIWRSLSQHRHHSSILTHLKSKIGNVMDNSQNIFGRTCYGWSNFVILAVYLKVLPIYVGKIKFQGTLFMKWQFLIQVTGRKWKKILSNSGFLESYDDIIWFDLTCFFEEKMHAFYLPRSTLFRNKKFMLDEIILQKKNFKFFD